MVETLKPGVRVNCSTGEVTAISVEEILADRTDALPPEVVSKMAAMLALAIEDKLDTLEEYADGPQTPVIHRIYIRESNNWNRTHPMVQQLAQQLYGWGPDEVAEWFKKAAAIE